VVRGERPRGCVDPGVLCNAAMRDDAALIGRLVRAGADIQAVNRYGVTRWTRRSTGRSTARTSSAGSERGCRKRSRPASTRASPRCWSRRERGYRSASEAATRCRKCCVGTAYPIRT